MTPKPRSPKLEALIIFLIILLPMLFFWRVVTPNPADHLHLKAGDFTEQYFPLRAFSAREWVNGRVPLWNPHIFGGQPALADIQSGALYPPHVAEALILGWAGIGFPVWVLEWQVILHFSLAGVGAYLLERYLARRAKTSWRVARFVGVVVSLTFTYSGYLTGFPVQQMTILLASAWLPWVMWALVRTFDAVTDGVPMRVSLAWAGGTALAFAMAILAGHPQTVMYIFYLMTAYGVFRIFTDKSHTLSFIAHYSLLVILGGLISGAQLLPTLNFIRQSLRADLSFSTVSAGLPLSELVSILYPGYFGGSPEYVGILPLLFVAAALVLSRRKLRGIVSFWTGVASVSLILAFGAHTFAYQIFYLAAPGFDAVRQQERIFLLFAFSMAILAGYGALALAMPFPKSLKSTWQIFVRNSNRVGAVALALTGLFLYGAVAANARGDTVNLFNGVLRHHIFGLIIFSGGLLMLAFRPRRFLRRWWGMAAVSLWLAFNLFSVNWQFNLENYADEIFSGQGVGQFLLEHTTGSEPMRIASGGLLAGGNNAAAVLGLDDITGNTPLQLANVAKFSADMPAWRLWQLMNVRYVADTRDIDGAGLARRFEADGVKVFEVTDPFPMARVVHRVKSGDDWHLLAGDDFDLKTTAHLPTDAQISLDENAAGSSARVTETHAGFLGIEAKAAGNGLLVLSQIDYPGWVATLDGEGVPILRVNGIFQGIAIPTGTHILTFAFQPKDFRWGVGLSVLGLLLSLGLIAWGSRQFYGGKLSVEQQAR